MKIYEEVISSLEVESYLENYINDNDNCLQEKIIMCSFFNEYMMCKNLYAVEVIRDGCLYLRVENENDEIVSNNDMFLGGITKFKGLTIDDYELVSGSDHTINFYVNGIIADENICADDKICMIREYVPYMNRGLYKMDAVDMFGRIANLILDQKNDDIIDRIYY